jgi:hypothetical protein
VKRQKAPAAQWYFGDWQRDTALRSCSLAARGLWMEMLCVMHDGTPRGTMRAGDRRLDDLDTIARMSGAAPSDEVPKLFSELETAGVFSREPDGTIFSRRMVRDTHLAQVRSDAGAKGGSTTQQKLRDYSAEKEAAATVVAERRPPQSTAPALGELKSARAEGEASIKTFTQLHSDVREEALADVKHATSLAEINASVFAARQQHLRGEIEAKAAPVGMGIE